MRYLWGSVFPWYFGEGVAWQWEGHGASCKWLMNGLLGRCCELWRRWWRWLVLEDVVKLWRWWGEVSVWWERVDVVLMLPLNQLWLLSLLLLAKDIDGILQFCEPCSLPINVLPMSFGMLSDFLPSHDGFMLLPEPLYLLLYPDPLFLFRCDFVLFCFLILVLC
jgi:hypothetical protein